MECLVDESLISPRRTTLKTNPPRINAATPDARHRGSGESGDWHRRLSARPIGTVVQDRAAVDLLTAWVASNPESWARIAATCGPGRS